MNFPMPTTNRTILITGISRGIGHGLALACLRRGDTVLGLGRNTAADLESRPDFHFARADVTDGGACAAALETLLRDRDRLDCVILSAGVLEAIDRLPGLIESGALADIRNPPLAD